MGMLRPLMELPGPLVQGAAKVRRSRAARPLGALTGGFLTSSAVLFALLAFTGAAFGVGSIPVSGRVATALALTLGMLAVDVSGLRKGPYCRLTLQRQTPKVLDHKYGPVVGSLLWGLDTGLAWTTIRVSTATWVVFGLTVLQLAPWWTGLAYGVGFGLPLAVSTLGPRWRAGEEGGEPQWLVRLMYRVRPFVRAGCLAGLLAVGVLLAWWVLSGG